ALTLLREVDLINTRRRHRMVDLAVAECGGSVSGRRVAVLGAAFKPFTDDVRDSPALHVAAQLQLQGAEVRVYDPKANDQASRIFPTMQYVDTARDAVRGAGLLLHLTEWPEFADLDPVELLPLVREPRILDGRTTLDAERWRSAGWSFRALGRPLKLPPSEATSGAEPSAAKHEDDR
ncbi:MAG: UDP binding domain-containing protein, partial [Nocardioidaceae bacterium]